MSEGNAQGGGMTVRLVATDGTVLFVGAVDTEDASQFIKYEHVFNGPSRLQVNVTDLAARGVRMIQSTWGPIAHRFDPSRGEEVRRFGCMLASEFAEDGTAIRAAWAAECRAHGGHPVEPPSWRVANPVLDEIEGVKQEPVLIVEGLARRRPPIDPCGGNTRGGPGCTCDPSF